MSAPRDSWSQWDFRILWRTFPLTLTVTLLIVWLISTITHLPLPQTKGHPCLYFCLETKSTVCCDELSHLLCRQDHSSQAWLGDHHLCYRSSFYVEEVLSCLLYMDQFQFLSPNDTGGVWVTSSHVHPGLQKPAEGNWSHGVIAHRGCQ